MMFIFDNMNEPTTTTHFKKEIPLFHASYDIFIGSDGEAIKEHIDETFSNLGVELPGNALGYTTMIDSALCGKGVIVILNTFLSDQVEVEKTIYHEAVHVTWMLLKALGITITYDNHEIQAYLIEHIITDMLSALKEHDTNNNDVVDL